MNAIPPLIRKAGLNADVDDLRRAVTATPRAQIAYDTLAERLAQDAEFYSLRALDGLISPWDRKRYQGLAEALWREHEAAKASAALLADYGRQLLVESAHIIDQSASLQG